MRTSLTVDEGGGPVATSYVWDVNRSLPVVLQDGTNTYVYGLDLISATDGGGGQTFFATDGLGSTTDLTDGSGDVTDTYSYDVFGALRANTGSTPNNWLFTGEQHDADSDLYYLRARYYDPATGRFLSTDPTEAGHPYGYGANNPVLYSDPQGLDLCSTATGLFGKKKDCGEVAGGTVNAIENVASTAADTAKDAAPYAVACNPIYGPIAAGTCTAAVFSGVTNSYYDLNFTLGCHWLVTGGLQYNARQGIYGYAGGGRGSCGASGMASVGFRQSISSGVSCGLQGQVVVAAADGVPITIGGQVGVSGASLDLGGKEAVRAQGTSFHELGFGAGTTGWSATCYYIQPLITW
jgi:RHS repeat-associated protein